MKFYLEDMSTKLPFKDPIQHQFSNRIELHRLIEHLGGSNPKILRLSTKSIEASFGIDTDPSFVECFEWNVGQAKYAKSARPFETENGPVFKNAFKIQKPPKDVLLPYNDVMKIIEFLVDFDKLPEEYQWNLSIDWDVTYMNQN